VTIREVRTATRWGATLTPYRQGSTARAVWELASTLTLYAAGWVLMVLSLRVSYALTVAVAIPTAFLLVRVFILQHDCGHGSLFKSQRVADVVGTLLGVLTLTPYAFWKKTHAIHHATSGNLDARGYGDIDVLTVDEYQRLSPKKQRAYRIYRHPLILFVLGAVAYFVICYRAARLIPTKIPREWRRERASIWWTNLGAAIVVAAMVLLLGWRDLLLLYAPVLLVSSSLGVWLFYLQHQYEVAYWDSGANWDFEAAALQGSSYYKLPRVLHWFTGNIGYHHIHHLAPRIPFYRLPEVHAKHAELQQVPTLTIGASFRFASLTLWDEATRTLVSFATVRARAAAPADALADRRAA
jgi:omega-6 fatty acid desaturase (delta-12 desaturase)